MVDYINVNFFWGGEIIRRNDDVRYSIDPKEMQYIKLGTSYEELKEIVFGVMRISPAHWKVNLRFKYPQLGIGNLVTGYYLKKISSDDDVRRMLSIPTQMQMGMGDVSVYIEAENIVPDDPYSYDQGLYSHPIQQSYNQDFENSQYSDHGISGWSDKFFGTGTGDNAYQGHGGVGYETQGSGYGGHGGGYEGHASGYEGHGSGYGGHAGGYEGHGSGYEGHAGGYVGSSSSHGFGGYSQELNYSGGNVSVELPPTRKPITRGGGKELARIEENEFSPLSSSEDEEQLADDGEEVSESEDDEDGIPTNNEIVLEHHKRRVPWFETEKYSSVIVTNNIGMPLIFDAQNSELAVGAMFRDKETLIAAVREVHISSDRNYHVERSTPKMFKAKCVVPNCPWKLRAAKKEKHAMFEITVCPVRHTCLINEPLQDHRKLSAKLISKIVKPHVMETPHMKVMSIITMVNDVYNHHVNYQKAWRGKQLAVEEVYGKWSTTYEELPMFMMAMLHANPGSAVEIDAIPKDNQSSICKRIFWCLKPMMDGWQYARPVISIDGTFLKGKYNGKLLVAMGVDANNHQYPICYALVDEESYENWSWFLKLLRKHVCRERLGVCIISDRASGILAAMREDRNGFKPPFGIHRFCLFHVRSNFASKHPGNELKLLCWQAGITPQVRKHEACMNRIGEISIAALEYLREINPELWTLCHDTGCARYGQATTNIMEGFNGNIRMTRFLPVTSMMEYLFYRTVKIVNTQRNKVVDRMQAGEEFCARSMNMLSKIIEKANSHKVETFSRQRGIFSVTTHRYLYKSVWKGGNKQNVNIQNMSCTCGKWACHRMPCSHVVAGCNANSINWRQWIGPLHYTSNLHMMWEPVIHPLAPIEYWNYQLPRKWLQYGKLVPDEALRKVKKKRGDKGLSVRIRTEMDQTRSSIKCSRCKQEGHTKRSKHCPQRQG